ncbi:hypothetical protein LJC23_07770, partial [Desulfovibrio sp. OttesenSCG-928-I05]|nr:hypothetical protein [Desulfovibrio sp. OttesenSCG-928-I05]
GEVHSSEIPALLAKAYPEFCYAAGIAQHTPRARQHWTAIVMDAAASAPEESRDAMLAVIQGFAR